MTDGHLLQSINGLTHTTYMHDTPDQDRLVVGNQTVVSRRRTELISPFTGQLLKYLIPDGGHVMAGNVYAEMEVMKMVTAHVVKESGAIVFSVTRHGTPDVRPRNTVPPILNLCYTGPRDMEPPQ